MSTSYQSKVKIIKPRSIVVRGMHSLDDHTIEEHQRSKKRVCAYCRVSTDQEEQKTSYELQVDHYTDFISKNELWEFSGIYADEVRPE